VDTTSDCRLIQFRKQKKLFLIAEAMFHVKQTVMQE